MRHRMTHEQYADLDPDYRHTDHEGNPWATITDKWGHRTVLVPVELVRGTDCVAIVPHRDPKRDIQAGDIVQFFPDPTLEKSAAKGGAVMRVNRLLNGSLSYPINTECGHLLAPNEVWRIA